VDNNCREELGGRNTDEWKIYEMITRHFLACVSRDAKGHEKKIKVSSIIQLYFNNPFRSKLGIKMARFLSLKG
jgi:DNA topoisomerase IA